jgi:hypothetical protein
LLGFHALSVDLSTPAKLLELAGHLLHGLSEGGQLASNGRDVLFGSQAPILWRGRHVPRTPIGEATGGYKPASSAVDAACATISACRAAFSSSRASSLACRGEKLSTGPSAAHR